MGLVQSLVIPEKQERLMYSQKRSRKEFLETIRAFITFHGWSFHAQD